MCNRVAIIKEGNVINIQDIKSMQKDNYKKIRVSADGLDGSRFNVEGVTKFEQSNGTANFFFKGDINSLLKLIGQSEVTDLVIEEPTLEEIFMHYYE